MPRILKFGTNVGYDLLYCVKLNFWSHFSVRPTKLELDTHMCKELLYCVHQIQGARIYLFLYFCAF